MLIYYLLIIFSTIIMHIKYNGKVYCKMFRAEQNFWVTWIFFDSANFTYISLASHKKDTDKQCRPRSDAAEYGVWSGSTLFALS